MSYPPPPEGESPESGEQDQPETGPSTTGQPSTGEPAAGQPGQPGHEGYGQPGYGYPGYGQGQQYGAGQQYAPQPPYGHDPTRPYPYDPNQPPYGYDPNQPPYAYGGQQQYSYDPHQAAYAYGQPPFQQHPYYYPGAPKPEHPGAVPSLVIGLLGLVLGVFCGLPLVLGPWAWVKGKRTMDEIDASGGHLGGRGMAQAGFICGIVATVLLGLTIVLGVLALVVAVVSTGRTG